MHARVGSIIQGVIDGVGSVVSMDERHSKPRTPHESDQIIEPNPVDSTSDDQAQESLAVPHEMEEAEQDGTSSETVSAGGGPGGSEQQQRNPTATILDQWEEEPHDDGNGEAGSGARQESGGSPEVQDVSTVLRVIKGRIERGSADARPHPGGQPRHYTQGDSFDHFDDTDLVEMMLYVHDDEQQHPPTPQRLPHTHAPPYPDTALLTGLLTTLCTRSERWNDDPTPQLPRRLQRYRIDGGGSLAVLRDTSYSMLGHKTLWAESLTTALVALARRKRMHLAYLEFSDSITQNDDGTFFVRDYDAIDGAARSAVCGKITLDPDNLNKRTLIRPPCCLFWGT